jgi:outer membrane immunogenic protein
MKALILALLASSSMIILAQAADLPSKKQSPDAPVAVQPASPSWTGFYVGGFGGYSWGSSAFDAGSVDSELGAIPTTSGTSYAKGAIYGIHAGYDYDFGNNLVMGVVADMAGISGQGTQVCVDALEGCTGGGRGYAYSYGQAHIRDLSTLRARMGFSTGSALIYVTGGAAYAHSKADISNFAADNSWSSNRKDWGWAIGTGLEYRLTQHVSFGADYMHADFGSENYTFTGLQSNNSTVGSSVTTLNLKDDSIKLSLNYRF